MIVTTAGRTDEETIQYAKEVAIELNCIYKERRKVSIPHMQETYQEDILVVGRNRLQLYPKGNQPPFFFHPNSATFRVKRLMDGKHDPIIETAGLRSGMRLLDCTLGLASDSIVASYVVGETGCVTGIEHNRYVAYLAKQGLQQWDSGMATFNEAMKRINVVNAHHLAFLKSCEENEYDVVYFDPMFEASLLHSDGIEGIKAFACYDELLEESIMEAKRVAKEKVILKDHYQSDRFNRFGFQQIIRKTSKFHFGYINVT
ncbi:MAG: class I SAM-dependent methyltransferase [Bacillaceae bacterium]